MLRNLLCLAAIALLAGAGVVHGIWTERWGHSIDAAAMQARLTAVPLTAGSWTGHVETIDPRQLALAEADGYLFRRYVDHRTGSVVTLMLLGGRPGPIAVHTPDICFPGSGFREVGEPTECRPDSDRQSQFLVRAFRKEMPAPTEFRVIYGWTTSGRWEAPENPRIAFARRPVLYKLYFIRELQRSNDALEKDPILDLYQKLQPQLQAAINGSAKLT